MAVTEKNRRRFENLGAQVVRNDIGMGVFIEPGADREQALEWLAKIDRREKLMSWVMFGLTVVAAVAAVIAAWPVIMGRV